MSVEVTASSSQITATASGSAVQAAVGSTIVSASSSGGIGPQGAQGPAGDDALWNFQGVWSGGTIYNVGAVVTNGGETWYCLRYAPAGYGPFGGYIDDYWTLLAKAGDPGAQGEPGSAGESGVVGVSAPITNSGTSTAASLGLSFGSGLGVIDGTLIVASVPQSSVSGLSDTLLLKANATHAHGSITSDGKIGTTSGRIVVTTSNGLLTTAASIALSQLSQSSATTGQVAAWNGSAWAPAAAGGYTLPNATTSTLGGVIVGTGLGVTTGTISVSYGSSSSTACVGNDARLSDARTPTAHNQAWSTITSTPTSLSGYGITDAVGSSDARLTDSRTPTAHTHGLGDLTQGGATNGQVIAWSGSAWAPATVSGGGGGSTSASDLTSGTLADARLSDKARAANNLYLWSNFR